MEAHSLIIDRSAIVVGGAIGGTTVALLLAGAGMHVTLFERVAEPRAIGAAILLQPNGLGVLYGLGLGDQLNAHGMRIRDVVLQDGAGRVLTRSRMPDFGGLDHALVIPRSHLLDVLSNAVATHPLIEAHYGARVESVTPAGTVAFEEAGDQNGGNALHTREAELIVGADGLHSRVREQGRFGAMRTPTGVSYVRGLSSARINVAQSCEAWTRLGIFGMAPLREGSYFYTSASSPALADALAQHNLPAFRAAWSAAYPESRAILDPLDKFEDLLLNEVSEVHCAHFVDERLVLVGDAAHAMAPNLGQGANSAIVDALVLAYELIRTPHQAEALRRYDERRRPAVVRVQRTARLLARLGDLPHPRQRWLRDNAMRLLLRIPGSSARAARDAQQESPAWLQHTARALTGGRA